MTHFYSRESDLVKCFVIGYVLIHACVPQLTIFNTRLVCQLKVNCRNLLTEVQLYERRVTYQRPIGSNEISNHPFWTCVCNAIENQMHYAEYERRMPSAVECRADIEFCACVCR